MMNAALLITEINSKVATARRNVETAHTKHMTALNSGLDNEGFDAVTDLIIVSLMDLTRTATDHVQQRLQVLLSPNTNRNFHRDLRVIELMADIALENSELAIEQMNTAVADAEDWRSSDED